MDVTENAPVKSHDIKVESHDVKMEVTDSPPVKKNDQVGEPVKPLSKRSSSPLEEVPAKKVIDSI